MLGEGWVAKQVSLVKTSGGHRCQGCAIRGLKPEGARAGLKAHRHGLKGMVATPIVRVGANSNLAWFAEMARPDLWRSEGVQAVPVTERPFPLWVKRSGGTRRRGVKA